MLSKKNAPPFFQEVLARRKSLRERIPANETYPSPNDIDRVIVILGSSRSGSSLLHHLLSEHPEIISLQGEEVTFTKMFGLNSINHFDDSDLLKSNEYTCTPELAQEILFDAGYKAENSERFILDRAQRLLLQWPEINFDSADLIHACSLPNWEEVIGHLKTKYPKVEIGLYDQFLNGSHEGLHFLEEPPFVVPKFKTYKKEVSEKILLLKSSVNAFRADYLFSLFPKAKFQFIHLTRNPAASINGLIDGWLSSAFHSHNVSHLTELSISSYENKSWWKFDLPPGWKNFTNKSLEEVCTFQWLSANQSILNFLENKKAVRVKYEEMSSEEELFQTLRRICHELELNGNFIETLSPPPSVMSVHKPHQYRWKMRAETLIPLFQSPEIAALSLKLGYNVHNLSELK